ncbi:MAG: hypothetical protein BWY82_00843 [Verrucomicrobia bacterium ADurb.Bin474]|nr:MAG: hypothetical protein BWY82_00843 [Verrucomicrobia bacterium ADurb.Bin474]
MGKIRTIGRTHIVGSHVLPRSVRGLRAHSNRNLPNGPVHVSVLLTGKAPNHPSDSGRAVVVKAEDHPLLFPPDLVTSPFRPEQIKRMGRRKARIGIPDHAPLSQLRIPVRLSVILQQVQSHVTRIQRLRERNDLSALPRVQPAFINRSIGLSVIR